MLKKIFFTVCVQLYRVSKACWTAKETWKVIICEKCENKHTRKSGKVVDNI